MKPALELSAQIALLRARGLDLNGWSDFETGRLLVSNGYYRLSGYWRYWQKSPGTGLNDFNPGANLKEIVDVYNSDAELRAILADMLAAVEVALRSRLTHKLSTTKGADAYLSTQHYSARKAADGHFLRDELITDISRELARSKEPFIRQHLDHGDDAPMWAAVEALSFGTVSKMYRLVQDRNVAYFISKSFNLPNPEVAYSVFRSLAVLRNICAHHGRLWNKVPTIPLQVLERLKEGDPAIYNQTPWGWIVMLQFLSTQLQSEQIHLDRLSSFIAAQPDFLTGLQYPRPT